jgi:hypothetical protein
MGRNAAVEGGCLKETKNRKERGNKKTFPNMLELLISSALTFGKAQYCQFSPG